MGARPVQRATDGESRSERGIQALMRAFIGVGTNLGDRWRSLALAASRLRSSGAVAIVRASSVWDTEPMGPPQPRYLNAVLEVETPLTPRALLELLRSVERAAHRRRDGARWGARTLDLDLLLYGSRTVNEPGLVIPHPGVASRPFVLAPLAEIAPSLILPGSALTVRQLVGATPPEGISPAGLYPL
jgi:2-amino-4-hydroxy-6-hydroxymethyldihydropteridine diphosphokinase